MGTQATGAQLVQDKTFQNLLEKLDADADAAEAQWKAQLRNSNVVKFPTDLLAEYRDDGAKMLKARGEFNLEWNKIVAGKGDPKKLLSSYDAYSGNLEALNENNARFEALITIDLAGKAAAWMLLFLAFAKAARKVELERELRELIAELKKAEQEVTDAKLKRALNVALSAATLVAAPESVLARAAVAAGGITVHVIIDNALGHGTAKGTVVFVVGDGVDAVEKLSEASKKFVGAAAAVVTFKFDSDEVGHAQEVVKRLRPRLERVQKALKELLAGVLPLVPKMRELAKAIQALGRVIQLALTKKSDATLNYQAIKDSIKKSL